MNDLRAKVETAIVRLQSTHDKAYDMEVAGSEGGAYFDGKADGLAIALKLLKAAIADAPSTGYDVWVSEDAPEFKEWERVAWFLASAGATRYIDEECGGFEIGRWRDDDTMEVWAGKYMLDPQKKVVRLYRRLPVGSPAPGAAE